MSPEKLGWEYLGILKEMPLGYQNMYLLMKNMCQLKIRVGIPRNAQKNAFRISEYIPT